MQITHDVHVHNFLSSCSNDNQATVESYIEVAKSLGIKLIGFSNHTWDERVPLPKQPFEFYRYQSLTYQMQIKSQIPKEVEGLKILVGAETEYCGMFDCLGMSREGAMQLDFLLIPHSHVHMKNFVMPKFDEVVQAQEHLAKKLEEIDWIPKEHALKMAKALPEEALVPFMVGERQNREKLVSDFMVNSFRSLLENEELKSYSDLIPVSIAHPFQPVAAPNRMEMLKMISDETYGDLFTVAAKRGIGLEINYMTNNEEDFRLFGIAKECGCKFTLGSDMHSRAGMKNIFMTQPCLDHIGATEDDLMDFVRI